MLAVRGGGHAAIPGVRRIEPAAEPNLDDGQIHARIGEPAERHRGEQLELGRIAVAPSNAVGEREHSAGETREGIAIDGLAIDLQPFAEGDEVRLGCFADSVTCGPQGGIHQRQDAALTVCARYQRAAEGPFRVAEARQKSASPGQAQVDPEPATRVEGGKGSRIVGQWLMTAVGLGR